MSKSNVLTRDLIAAKALIDVIDGNIAHILQHPIEIISQHAPLSVNLMFRNVAGKGRVKTQRYKEWLQAAGWDFNGKGSIKGGFSATIVINSKNRRKGSDIDNRIKCCLDALKTHGIIEDDSLCEEVRAVYAHDVPWALRIEVWPK